MLMSLSFLLDQELSKHLGYLEYLTHLISRSPFLFFFAAHLTFCHLNELNFLTERFDKGTRISTK